MEMSLCGSDSYNLNYFQIRETRFTEFCKFVSRLNDYNNRKFYKGKEKRHAGDSWF